MYNMKFGESILITRENQIAILSDLGSKWDEEDMRTTYDKVINHLSSIDAINLYISHFHLDHYSGLIYAYHNGIHLNINELILSDINNISVIKALLTTACFKAILSKCVLPASRTMTITLLDFILFICTNINRTKFLHRGDFIDNNTILWPDQNLITTYSEEIFEKIKDKIKSLFGTYVNNNSDNKLLEKFFQTIDEYSELIDQAFQGKNHLNNDVFQGIIPIIDDLGSTIISNKTLREEFLESYLDNETRNKITELLNREDLDDIKLVDLLLSENIKLNRFEHAVCLVFHNEKDDDLENYLFTGDIEKNNLKKIINNFDKKCPLHKYYKYFKVPHHGTNSQKYYTDLIENKLEPDSYLIISNGKRMKHTKRFVRHWNIDKKYYDIKLCTYRHFCSNTDNCKGYSKRCCTCKKSIFINRAYKNSI